MDHLTEADIILYLEGRLSGERKEAFERHLAECDRCLSVFADLSRLEERLEGSTPPGLDEATLEKAKSLVPEKNSGNGTVAWRAAAAVLLLLAALFAFYRFTPDGGGASETYRSQEGEQAVVPAGPEDGSNLTEGELRFAWHPVENSASYRLELLRPNGLSLWERLTEDTTLTLPSDLSLQPDSLYLWRIEVLMPDGRTLRSELRSFQFQSGRE